MVLLAILGTLTYASLLEWAVHRYGYHCQAVWKAGTDAHTLHHEVRYPASRFFERGGGYATSQPWWLEAVYVALHLPLFAALARSSLAAAAASAVVLSIYAVLAHYLHPLTHLRTGRFYERTRLFKWLIARHVRHHQDQAVNFNLVFPLGDLIFGTLDRGPEREGASRA